MQKFEDRLAKADAENAALRRQLDDALKCNSSLQELNDSLHKELDEFKVEKAAMAKKIESIYAELEKEKEKSREQRRVMLVRQMASSFQEKSCVFTGAFEHAYLHMVTPAVLKAKVDKLDAGNLSNPNVKSKFQKLLQKISSVGFTADFEVFDLLVKQIRELGIQNSHPHTILVDDREEMVDYNAMKKVSPVPLISVWTFLSTSNFTYCNMFFFAGH